MASRDVNQMLVALLIATACGTASAPVATTSQPPTPMQEATTTPPAAHSPTPSPTPLAVFDDHFGFVIYAITSTPGPYGLRVRFESGPQPAYNLHSGGADGITVSPDGRRVAYWTGKELRVLDISPTARPLTLLTIATKEYGSHIAWSSDGTGLVVGVIGGPGVAPDAPPPYTAIRVVDAAGGALHEVIRIPNASVQPIAWDRASRLIAAHEPAASGTLSYDTITEAGALKRTSPGSPLYFPQASNDAQHVFGRNLVFSLPFGSTILRVWPVGSYASGVELRSANGKAFITAEWRPGTAEIGVLFDDHLEFWTARGGRRTIALPPLSAHSSTTVVHGSLTFRTDGKAVFVDRQVDPSPDTYSVAVDLATNQTSDIAGAGGTPAAGTSIRIGP